MRDDAKLAVLMQGLFTHLGLDQVKVYPKWLAVYDLTARNLHNYGKVKEAVTLLEQVVKIEEQTLAEDHPDRLASSHALAIAYEANGQMKEAVTLLEQQRSESPVHDASSVPYVSKGYSCTGARRVRRCTECAIRQVEGGF